jgi:hypothetical protein
VRLRKRDLRAPVKGDLDITFSAERISAHGGLEIFRRYLQALEIPRRLREARAPHGLHTDYGAVGIAFSILALILIGGRRVTHLAFLCADPIVKRFAGLRQLPVLGGRDQLGLGRGAAVALHGRSRRAREVAG